MRLLKNGYPGNRGQSQALQHEDALARDTEEGRSDPLPIRSANGSDMAIPVLDAHPKVAVTLLDLRESSHHTRLLQILLFYKGKK